MEGEARVPDQATCALRLLSDFRPYWEGARRLATPATGAACFGRKRRARSLTSVGTNGRLFCFQPDCRPLLAAGWVCASLFGSSSGALAEPFLGERARRRPRGDIGFDLRK